MIKFEGSDSLGVELCGYNSQPRPMYLNRQVIKILEDIGIRDYWFLDLQSQEVQRLKEITVTAANTAKFLKSNLVGQHSHLPWFIKKLFSMDLEFRSDRFLQDVLEMCVMIQIRIMKYRARIPVPFGLTLYGIMDETNFLKEGQIFCTYTKGGKKKQLIGRRMVITRAPALHPGDVQIVDAVNVPRGSPLQSLTNCICFSQQGDRDLPSKLSGGDLDGDLYNIIWDKRCKPSRCHEPADYPRQIPQDIDRKVDREDMTDFFIKFMETDQLPRIATSHQVLADQKPLGTLDPDCKKLAELHSTAVDFSKTGIPVDTKLIPRYNPIRPDWLAPGPNIKIEEKEGLLLQAITREPDQNNDEDYKPYQYYRSQKILGKLYRAIDEHKIFRDLRKYRSVGNGATTLLDQVWDYVQRRSQLVNWHQYLTEAHEIRDMYEGSILNIMKNYSEQPRRPLSEREAFIGNILSAQGSQSKKQRDLSITMKEAFDRDVAYIVSCIIGSPGISDERSRGALGRSMACFSVSLEEPTRVPMGGRKNEPLVSFRYLAAALCLRELDGPTVRASVKAYALR